MSPIMRYAIRACASLAILLIGIGAINQCIYFINQDEDTSFLLGSVGVVFFVGLTIFSVNWINKKLGRY